MTPWLADTNVWLALALSGHRHHGSARDWLDRVREPSSVLFCRATQQSLLRLLSTAAVLAPYGNAPLSNDAAWQVYEAFAADERVGPLAAEPPGLTRQWVALAARPTASPKLWMNAYLAAFARTGGYRLLTLDSAFGQFDGVDVLVLGEPA